MTKKQLNILLIASSSLALVACTAENSVRFNQEAGAFIDEGNFGNPTMNNTLVMTGQKSYVVNLNRRFAEEVDTSVNFAFDSAVLDGAARATLMEQANWIRQFPEVRFKVFGHTDLVGSEAYNKSLGLRRARAAVNFLVSQGISRSRLEAVVSFGETQPLVVTQDEEVKNRRTVTEVTGFVRNHPAVLNGKYAAIIFRDYVAEGAVQTPGGGELAGGE